jgi:hypothetical protein
MKKIYRFGAILMVFGLACLGVTQTIMGTEQKIDPSKPVGRCTQDFCDAACARAGGYSNQLISKVGDDFTCDCRIEGAWTSGGPSSRDCYNEPPKIPPPAGRCTPKICDASCARAGYDSTKSVWFDESRKRWNCRCIKGDELKMVWCSTQVLNPGG